MIAGQMLEIQSIGILTWSIGNLKRRQLLTLSLIYNQTWNQEAMPTPRSQTMICKVSTHLRQRARRKVAHRSARNRSKVLGLPKRGRHGLLKQSLRRRVLIESWLQNQTRVWRKNSASMSLLTDLLIASTIGKVTTRASLTLQASWLSKIKSSSETQGLSLLNLPL